MPFVLSSKRSEDSWNRKRINIECIHVWYIPFYICLYICPGIVDHDLSLVYAFHLLLLLFEPPAKIRVRILEERNPGDSIQMMELKSVPPPLWLFSLSLLPQNLPFQSEMPKNKSNLNMYPKTRHILRRIEYTVLSIK